MSEAVHPVPQGFNARIGPAELADSGAVRRNQPVKILGTGELNGIAIQISAHAFSASAKEKIAAAGGTATELK